MVSCVHVVSETAVAEDGLAPGAPKGFPGSTWWFLLSQIIFFNSNFLSTVSSAPYCGLSGPSVFFHFAFCLSVFAATQLSSLKRDAPSVIDDAMWLSEFENENVNGVDETRKLTKIWLIFLVYVSLKVTDHHLGG